MTRLFPAVALVASISTACIPKTRTGATASTVAGTAIAAVGTMMLVDLKSPGDDTNGNGRDDFPENDIACAFGGCAIALALIATGVVLGVSGLAGFGSIEKEAAPEVAIPRAATGAATPAAARPKIDSRLLAPLPELAADAETIRLAQQVRGAARHGHCDAAAVVIERIRERHPGYAHALSTGPVLAPCAR